MTSIYMYAKVPTGTPHVTVLGNLRPTESALNEARDLIAQNYDSDKAEETLQNKADSLPQERSIDYFDGSFVLLGIAEFNKNTGEIEVKPRNYEFSWGEINLTGRKPTQCDKGYYESTEKYYTPSDTKPADW